MDEHYDCLHERDTTRCEGQISPASKAHRTHYRHIPSLRSPAYTSLLRLALAFWSVSLEVGVQQYGETFFCAFGSFMVQVLRDVRHFFSFSKVLQK